METWELAGYSNKKLKQKRSKPSLNIVQLYYIEQCSISQQMVLFCLVKIYEQEQNYLSYNITRGISRLLFRKNNEISE